MTDTYDVLVIGCGAVGAAVARELTLLGQKCMVLEKNDNVLGEASSGNTGHLVRQQEERFFISLHRTLLGTVHLKRKKHGVLPKLHGFAS